MVTRLSSAQCRHIKCVRNQSDAESVFEDFDQCQADTIDRDGAFVGHLSGELWGYLEPESGPLSVIASLGNGADCIDVSGDVMASHSVSDREASFEVHRIAGVQLAEIRLAERLSASLEGHLGAIDPDDRQTATVDADAITDCGVYATNFAPNSQIRSISFGNGRF